MHTRIPRTRSATAVAFVVAVGLLGSAAAGEHVVRRGETLSEIARDHGTSTTALARANGITDPDRVRAGQRLTIPGSGPRGHVVAPGETLASIARRHGTTPGAIAAANGLLDHNRIYAGTRLLLEATATAPPPTVGAGAHVVARGETLGAIARRHGTSVGELARLNGITNPDRVRAGAQLTVPGEGMRCPVPGSWFMNDWGFSRPGGRFHEGNDLFAPRGTPVRAPVAGRVEQVQGPVGGLQFNLYAADGTRYLGSHLAEFGASGQVSAGTVVGYVGDTGSARGGPPHLHFEVRPGDGPPINPYPLLVAACR
jgi:LysM repeat protein